QPSQNDAKEAVKTIKTIKNASRISNREIPFSILFTRISAAIITKTARYLGDEFKKQQINMFKNTLVDREAFKSIFSFGGSVDQLEAKDRSTVGSRQKALINAHLLAAEVKLFLKAKAEEDKKEV